MVTSGFLSPCLGCCMTIYESLTKTVKNNISFSEYVDFHVEQCDDGSEICITSKETNFELK